MRKTVQLLVILTILAWATQVLFHQWGYGAVIIPSRQALLNHATNDSAAATTAVRTIEVRPEAIATGEHITLRDVCRWNEDDQAALSPYADVVITRHAGSVTIDQIKSALADAGADLKNVKFSGAATCAVAAAGSDSTPQAPSKFDEPASPAALKEAAESPSIAAVAPTTQPQASQPQASQPQAEEYFEDQLILARSLSSGQPLIKSDITIKQVKVDAPATQPSLSIDQFVGRVAARDLKAGEMLDANAVKPPQAIAAGQFMTVSINLGATTVETVAKAMDDGGLGDTIKAKNEETGTVYTVQITGPNVGQQVTSTCTSTSQSNDHNVATTDNGAN